MIAVLVLLSQSTLAEPTTPIELQAQLLAKLVWYDRNFAARGGATAEVLLLVKPGDPRSKSIAGGMSFALSRIDRLGGRPHRETIVEYETASSLAQLCRTRHAAIVYVSSGFDADVDALRTALTGVDVLSVSALAEYVPSGIVLGFDLVFSKPKLLLNLPQAKKQNVSFDAEAVALMKVYR